MSSGMRCDRDTMAALSEALPGWRFHMKELGFENGEMWGVAEAGH